MGVLSGPEIERTVQVTAKATSLGITVLPAIEIEPFDPTCCGPNSYDIHLGPTLRVYSLTYPTRDERGFWRRLWDWISLRRIERQPELDSRYANLTFDLEIPPEGLVLQPGVLYLGSTVERTRCDGLVPWLDGRSSLGRLGMSLHVTAGRGDDGWSGQWTLEITVVHPLRVYPGMRVGQITFLTLDGQRRPYDGKYQNQTGPTASRMWQDKENT